MNSEIDKKIEVKLSGETRFESNEFISWRDIDNELVCMNVDNGEYFTFSEVGRAIWLLVTDGKSIEEAVKSLADEYEAGESVIREDAKKFIVEMLQNGLIKVV